MRSTRTRKTSKRKTPYSKKTEKEHTPRKVENIGVLKIDDDNAGDLESDEVAIARVMESKQGNAIIQRIAVNLPQQYIDYINQEDVYVAHDVKDGKVHLYVKDKPTYVVDFKECRDIQEAIMRLLEAYGF